MLCISREETGACALRARGQRRPPMGRFFDEGS
jgi:hypothetical protein